MSKVLCMDGEGRGATRRSDCVRKGPNRDGEDGESLNGRILMTNRAERWRKWPRVEDGAEDRLKELILSRRAE